MYGLAGDQEGVLGGGVGKRGSRLYWESVNRVGHNKAGSQ